MLRPEPVIERAEDRLEDRGGDPVVARGADGTDRSHELFARDGARLVARRSIVPIMMTTNPEIAHSDCLFYAVERQRPAGDPGLKPR